MKNQFNAWLEPDGTFHSIPYMSHEKWANDYFADKYGFIEGEKKKNELNGSSLSSYAHSALHKLGWIRLLTWTDGKTLLLGNCSPNKFNDTVDPGMTNSQKKTMKEWCRVNGFRYEDLFNEKKY